MIFRIELTTPLFSRGASEENPEIRPPSIRGQLHWWFRALGGSYADEIAVFGGVNRGAVASKVVIRVANIVGSMGTAATLPHKPTPLRSPKACYEAGTSFDMHIGFRLGGLDTSLRARFERTLETWLCIGALGLRATRAGGNFRWESIGEAGFCSSSSFSEFEARCIDLTSESSLKFALLREAYSNAEAARRVVTDTLGGKDDRRGQNSLARLNDPLGRVFGGRKTSPLRLRIVSIGGQHRIAAVWDGREEVTGNRSRDLPGIIRLLAQEKPALGEQLAASALAC